MRVGFGIDIIRLLYRYVVLKDIMEEVPGGRGWAWRGTRWRSTGRGEVDPRKNLRQSLRRGTGGDYRRVGNR